MPENTVCKVNLTSSGISVPLTLVRPTISAPCEEPTDRVAGAMCVDGQRTLTDGSLVRRNLAVFL